MEKKEINGALVRMERKDGRGGRGMTQMQLRKKVSESVRLEVEPGEEISDDLVEMDFSKVVVAKDKGGLFKKARRFAVYEGTGYGMIRMDLGVLSYMAGIGASDEIICQVFDIGHHTWQGLKRSQVIKDAMSVAGEAIDLEVVGATKRSATGYFVEEERLTKDDQVVKVKRHVPANATSQAIWLNNRKPDEFKYRKPVDEEGDRDVNVNVQVNVVGGKD